MVVGGNERSELRERGIAIAGGHVTKNLVVSPIFLDHIDDVLDRVTPAENQRSFSGFAFLISIPTIIGRHPGGCKNRTPLRLARERWKRYPQTHGCSSRWDCPCWEPVTRERSLWRW